MKPKLSVLLLVSATSLVAEQPGAPVQNSSTNDLAPRAIERRAVEAVIWGMPAVNYERMLQEAIRNGAKLNQVVYWSRPANWKNQTLTPNPDTIYLNPFYDTTKGSVVVEIPPADASAHRQIVRNARTAAEVKEWRRV